MKKIYNTIKGFLNFLMNLFLFIVLICGFSISISGIKQGYVLNGIVGVIIFLFLFLVWVISLDPIHINEFYTEDEENVAEEISKLNIKNT